MSPQPPDREQVQRLMMAALDGELSSGERAELDRLLAEDPGLRAEWQSMNRVKEVTATMKLKKPPEEIWQSYWLSVYNRIERGIGWILVSIGAIVLLGFGIWQAIQEFMTDPSVPGFVKLALFALFLGLAALVVSVFREKLFTRKHDPYKEVQR